MASGLSGTDSALVVFAYSRQSMGTTKDQHCGEGHAKLEP